MTLPTFRLADFFPAAELKRDGVFAWTLYPRAARPQALCYALTEEILELVNANPNITCVITAAPLVDRVASGKGVAVAARPQEAYYQLHNRLFREGRMKVHQEHAIHPGAIIAPTAVIGKNVVIGRDVTIGHHAVIEDYSIIGEGTLVGPHACIGSRGMQNTRFEGEFLRVEFAGGVKIGRNCEILTAAVVQKPYHCDYTEIGDATQISVKANVGHGVKIGSRTLVGGNAQIGGNTVIGDDVWIGQSATLADGLQIGNAAQIKMASAVVRNVPAGEAVSGNFALNHNRNLKQYTRLQHE